MLICVMFKCTISEMKSIVCWYFFYLFVVFDQWVPAFGVGYMRNTKEWAAARGGWGAQRGPAGEGARLEAACHDALGRLALVEHFFSLVFAEFQRAPPTCVCVQMCEQQATYCYPNGCLRREISYETPAPTPAPPAPLVPPPPPPPLSQEVINVEPVETEKLLPIGLRSEFYDDSYKNIYDYNKQPKLDFKYRPREHMKPQNAMNILKNQNDDLGIVKTRWPMKKYYGNDPAAGLKNDLTRGESLGRNYFFSSFYDDKDASIMNQNAKRATASNVTDQAVTKLFTIDEIAKDASELESGIVVHLRGEPRDVTDDVSTAAAYNTRLYLLDQHDPTTDTPSTTPQKADIKNIDNLNITKPQVKKYRNNTIIGITRAHTTEESTSETSQASHNRSKK